MTFFRIAHVDDLWSGEKRGLILENVNILLINHRGIVYAYENRCAHQGVGLSGGNLEENILTCPAHQWQYDVCTGRGINPKIACLKEFTVKVEKDEIFVDLNVETIVNHHAEREPY